MSATPDPARALIEAALAAFPPTLGGWTGAAHQACQDAADAYRAATKETGMDEKRVAAIVDERIADDAHAIHGRLDGHAERILALEALFPSCIDSQPPTPAKEELKFDDAYKYLKQSEIEAAIEQGRRDSEALERKRPSPAPGAETAEGAREEARVIAERCMSRYGVTMDYGRVIDALTRARSQLSASPEMREATSEWLRHVAGYWEVLEPTTKRLYLALRSASASREAGTA